MTANKILHSFRSARPWRIMPLLCGLLLVLTGTLVTAGWLFRKKAMVQIMADWPPMAANAGIMFLLAGISFLAIGSRFVRLSRFSGFVIALFGFATVLQHVIGGSFNVDFLLFPPFISTGVGRPTVIPPNSGFGFMILGSGIWLLGRKNYAAHPSLLVGVLGSLLGVLGGSVLVGFTMDYSWANDWGYDNKMAIHTAVSFIVAGMGVLAMDFQLMRERFENFLPKWLSVLPAVVILSATIILWQTLRHELLRGAGRALQTTANITVASLSRAIQARIDSLDFIVQRWSGQVAVSDSEKETEIKLLEHYFPDILMVQWINSSRSREWAISLSPQGTNDLMMFQPMEDARNTKIAVISKAYAIENGEWAFQIVIPRFQKDQFAGWLVGTFEIKKLCGAVLGGGTRDYSLQVYSYEELVCFYNQPAYGVPVMLQQEKKLRVLGSGWRLVMVPTTAFLKAAHSSIPEIILAGGCLISLLVYAVIRFYLMSRTSRDQLEQTNRALNLDIAERAKVLNALKQSEHSLKLAQRIGQVGGWELDIESKEFTWSDEALRLFKVVAWPVVPSNLDAFLELVHVEDVPAIASALKTTMTDGSPLSLDFRVVIPGKSEFIWHAQAQIIVDPLCGKAKLLGILKDITEVRHAQDEREGMIRQLQAALAEVKHLQGIIPICAGCKQIRDDKGAWSQMEAYIQDHSEAKFSHGLCPDCSRKFLEEAGIDMSKH